MKDDPHQIFCQISRFREKSLTAYLKRSSWHHPLLTYSTQQYVVVQTEELKEQVREAAFGQYKVHSASAAIIVLGDPNAYEHAGNIYEGLKC